MRGAVRCVLSAACLALAAWGAEGIGLDGANTIAVAGVADSAPLPTLLVESSAFADGGAIPDKHALHGGNVSPPLSWSSGPKGTVCYAVIVEDPGSPAGVWVHWIVWNVTVTRLAAKASVSLPSGAVQGRNSWERRGWDGPQPVDATHRYVFNVLALDTRLDLGRDARRADLEAAMRGHVLASGQLVGTYSAKR
jgi:Raf kinase inhibitor-like YbhB/YbcL family protein